MMNRGAIAAAGVAVAGGLAAWRARERLADWLTDSLARQPACWIGRRFYREARPHQATFLETLDVLALRAEDHLLEIGCGGGTFVEWALATGCSARAIDHSAEMLVLARERNATAIDDGRLALYETDAERLPFADDEFTAAAMTNVFFFLYRPEAVLAEIKRTLAPAGRVAIYTNATAFMAPPPIAHRMNFYTDDELHGLLQRAGYAEITVRRTGPGNRMQLATARKPDPPDQPT
jgi:ubiquinone/menaquinone biosynthesis C-methylase UbiE